MITGPELMGEREPVKSTKWSGLRLRIVFAIEKWDNDSVKKFELRLSPEFIRYQLQNFVVATNKLVGEVVCYKVNDVNKDVDRDLVKCSLRGQAGFGILKVNTNVLIMQIKGGREVLEGFLIPGIRLEEGEHLE